MNASIGTFQLVREVTPPRAKQAIIVVDSAGLPPRGKVKLSAIGA
jgi:hypothetical protein